MVLSVITLAAVVPLLATSTLQLQDQTQSTKDETERKIKTEKCHLASRASERMSPQRQDQFKDMRVFICDGYLWLKRSPATRDHLFAGYLLPFPDKSYDGIVSTINSENMLNWIFIDKESYRVRCGIRVEAQQQLTGPVTLLSGGDEWRVAFNGWEGFVAVQETSESWALYFDKDDNGLKDKLARKAVVEVDLVRTPLEAPRSNDGPD